MQHSKSGRLLNSYTLPENLAGDCPATFAALRIIFALFAIYTTRTEFHFALPNTNEKNYSKTYSTIAWSF
jgi:hypothetical protein